jgi:glutaredoxin
MKQVVRLFFKTIRLVVGPILLFVDWLSTPKGLIRGAAAQQAVNEATRQLTLYQFKTCPFCMKVRRAGKRLSLNIEKRDAQHDADARQELLQATGKTQVPCLKIVGADGSVRWMQDSGAIIQYLHERFAR